MTTEHKHTNNDKLTKGGNDKEEEDANNDDELLK